MYIINEDFVRGVSVSNLATKKYKLLSLGDLGKTNTSVVEFVSEFIELDEPTTYSIKLVLSELVINGFIHGNHHTKDIKVELSVDAKESTVELVVDDSGDGFDAEHSVRELNVESEQGRGLILVHAFSNNVTYNNIGNKVVAKIQI